MRTEVEFITIGGDDHPLGKRSIWLHPDGHAEMLSEAFGMRTTTNHADGQEVIDEIRAAFAAHDAQQGD